VMDIETQLLVEVTVVDTTIPTNGDRVGAHQVGHGVSIEISNLMCVCECVWVGVNYYYVLRTMHAKESGGIHDTHFFFFFSIT
jgi:hypothetical protein